MQKQRPTGRVLAQVFMQMPNLDWDKVPAQVARMEQALLRDGKLDLLLEVTSYRHLMEERGVWPGHRPKPSPSSDS